MSGNRSFIDSLIFGDGSTRRYMQGSPVLYDVWNSYAKHPWRKVDLLLTPFRGVKPGELCSRLREALKRDAQQNPDAVWREKTETLDDSAYNQANVAASLSFPETVRVVLPMTGWWIGQVHDALPDHSKWLKSGEDPLSKVFDSQRKDMVQALKAFRNRGAQKFEGMTPDILWLVQIIGSLAILRKGTQPDPEAKPPKKAYPRKEAYSETKVVDAVIELMRDLVLYDAPQNKLRAQIHVVNCNRAAETSIDRSTMAIKSDAALRLFEIQCSRITWAIVDSGVDARHPAFAKETSAGDWPKTTRVKESYDFSYIRHLLSPSQLRSGNENLPPRLREALAAQEKNGDELSDADNVRDEMADLKRALQKGRDLDWSLLQPFLKIPYDETYAPPANDHGTHVAGILAAGGDSEKKGVCPDINVIDIRVLDAQGEGNEFNVIAAMQFIRYLNGSEDRMVIHGANLSLSINHDVANYACGRTPVCDEADRLSASGVCVVAAAGNKGYIKYETTEGMREGYHTISITDPGNAEKVITVGATHRYRPHTYGVSYFSSRGPTGDGRLKPDLVAPGEKIEAPAPNGDWRVKDGTSMAAPHVSGAAALLMARHREMVGRPEEIKAILCKTATDLGRERYFQGHGMLDILRALQSV